MLFDFDLLFIGVSSLVIGVTFRSVRRFTLDSLSLAASSESMLTSSLSLTEID